MIAPGRCRISYNERCFFNSSGVHDMPIFEYVCEKCAHRFEAIVLGREGAACPQCSSKKLEQQISRFGVAKEAAPAGTPCGACGDPRGPGACSMN